MQNTASQIAVSTARSAAGTYSEAKTMRKLQHPAPSATCSPRLSVFCLVLILLLLHLSCAAGITAALRASVPLLASPAKRQQQQQETVVVRESRCYEKAGVTAGALGESFPFGQGKSSFLQVSASDTHAHTVAHAQSEAHTVLVSESASQAQSQSQAQWPNIVVTQCEQAFDAIACGQIGARKYLWRAPRFDALVKANTADPRALYSQTRRWLAGPGKGYQPTPSACMWCEAPGSGDTGGGVCFKCNSDDVNDLEMRGYTCAPHCAASVGAVPPLWEPRKVNPWFPVPPPQVRQGDERKISALLGGCVCVCVCLCASANQCR
jgi:hypothetical protein